MNLTITVDDETLKNARIRALQQGTSVNEVLRRHLEQYADTTAARGAALAQLFAEARDQATPSGTRRWSREDAYDDARFR